MEYRQKYESLIQTLCKAYNKIFRLLEGVEQCDKELARLSRINRPSVEEVCRVTEYKERLIVTMDQISIAIDPIHDQLDGIRALCQEIDSHPMYLHLNDLQLLVYYYIRQVINRKISTIRISSTVSMTIKNHSSWTRHSVKFQNRRSRYLCWCLKKEIKLRNKDASDL